MQVVNLRIAGGTSVTRDTIFGIPVILGKPCPVCGRVHSRL